MKWAIITLNKTSIDVARSIKESFKALNPEVILGKEEKLNINSKDIDIYTLDKYLEEGLSPIKGKLRAFNKYLFETYDAIVYVMAMGIIVRDISPYIKHKSTDPAVICVSVDGRFIIPVLSGHLGGANAIARLISDYIKAIPVITTASDLLGKEAVDLIAKKNDLIIDSFKTAMDLTSRMINDEVITVISELSTPMEKSTSVLWEDLDDYLLRDKSDGYVYIGYHQQMHTVKPVARLIAKKLVIGIGARKDTKALAIRELLEGIFKEHFLDIKAIKSFKSIDLKKEEAGIIEVARGLGVPFATYSAEELKVVSQAFEGSAFVEKVTGVGCVCMPSGYLGSNKGPCIVEKVIMNGITISIWEEL